MNPIVEYKEWGSIRLDETEGGYRVVVTRGEDTFHYAFSFDSDHTQPLALKAAVSFFIDVRWGYREHAEIDYTIEYKAA